MKQLFTIACIAFLLSCNTSKHVTKATASTDSTGTTTTSAIDVKKKDSTGTTSAGASSSKEKESTYKKKTTVREYFGNGDELDIVDGVDPKPEAKSIATPTKPKAPGKALKKDRYFMPWDAYESYSVQPFYDRYPVYRETTIEEEGAAKELEKAASLNEQTSKLHTGDSSKKDQNQAATVHNENSQSTKDKKTTAGGWVGLVAWVATLFVVAWVLMGRFPLAFLFRKKKNEGAHNGTT